MTHQPKERKNLDTGLALTLLTLLCYHIFPGSGTVTIATILLLVCMTLPRLFFPLAHAWFTLAEILAKAVSGLLLTLVFLLLVTPTGFLRRILKHDPLRLGAWHNGHGSLLRQRHHTWQPADLEHPY